MPKIDASWVTSFVECLAVGSSSPDDIRNDVDAFLSPSYVQNRHGVKSNYEDTILHLVQVRSAIVELKVELIDLVVDETKGKFASRHVAYVKNKEGKESSVEVALFGSFDDEGKLTYVYEMSRQL
ncbi:hypothetical protein, variant [Verruconis gallopava]|uniref:SnoaL-like domain-containing protein n=1 Tax=Verruconis gallopava TaxID=253628 RepID=A0A0D2AWX0_9PEZI|nr:uncharacterized protein PV09_04990 [Verruconis gallopava]XP_016213538.1 hypothetical protein, variant [Verruconis gallopava]KIW03668.1 hypothetical protein PV09_04990 [Verruconis gallopava]KIW03669.1 hypothetical protein, variant [Verruconis gallopava]